MRDVVLNRRILVVNLPALENSDATLAALGKLVVASLRGMMAQLLGASLEGDYTEADKPGMGPAPFPVVLDELAYYATSGLDRMLAMGRGLNICFMLGFQEVVRHLGAARREDGFPARQRQPHDRYAPAGFGAHARVDREDRRADLHHPGHLVSRRRRRRLPRGAHAEVRPVSRVDWNDLTTLIEGEAIVLFGGRRIYARSSTHRSTMPVRSGSAAA